MRYTNFINPLFLSFDDTNTTKDTNTNKDTNKDTNTDTEPNTDKDTDKDTNTDKDIYKYKATSLRGRYTNFINPLFLSFIRMMIQIKIHIQIQIQIKIQIQLKIHPQIQLKIQIQIPSFLVDIFYWIKRETNIEILNNYLFDKDFVPKQINKTFFGQLYQLVLAFAGRIEI